ncbi:Calpain-7-like protein [Trachymyrmex cornetzi]|uniref:Calpain-7-like protein n=1 Tax=Trachymyrmex cornetzi TaxID=471704 RepID=A0A195DSC8_9HYME|nr:Calpain-7-like protein [Trachymyrmex cornetzi]
MYKHLLGKYIVRLYCMGCWRRILVDDIVPVDKNGKPLLPRTSNNFELWPMLLAKALLKLASLTWTKRREIVDFHPITCFTGGHNVHFVFNKIINVITLVQKQFLSLN